MREGYDLFGDGPYPDAGILAIGARLAFLGAGLAIVVAVFLPSHLVPDFVGSAHLQHFAAFYVLTLASLAALPRTRMRRVAGGVFVFALLLESSHLLSGARFWPLVDNWVADLGGVAAALAPVVAERFRRRFPGRDA